MEDENGFELDSALNSWLGAENRQNNNKSTEAHEHYISLKQSVEEFAVDKGLTLEEAFAVVKSRYNGSECSGRELKDVNDENYHLRKISFLFAGILICFIGFYLIIISSELYFLILNHLDDTSTVLNLARVSQYIKSVYIIIIGVIVILFFMDHIIVNFLSRFRFKLSTALILIALLIVMVFTDKFLLENISSVIRLNGDPGGSFYKKMENIRFIYNVILGVGFLILYFRYSKKTLSPRFY